MWQTLANLFQFQYGSIKRKKDDMLVRDCCGFQFQYGSIKS